MGANKNTVAPGVGKIAKKAIRIIYFLPFRSSNIKKTYSDLKILKLPGFISLKKFVCERLL